MMNLLKEWHCITNCRCFPKNVQRLIFLENSFSGSGLFLLSSHEFQMGYCTQNWVTKMKNFTKHTVFALISAVFWFNWPTARNTCYASKCTFIFQHLFLIHFDANLSFCRICEGCSKEFLCMIDVFWPIVHPLTNWTSRWDIYRRNQSLPEWKQQEVCQGCSRF